MPQVSVVVCTRNRPELLDRALASLAGQTLARDRFEVIVVENGEGAEAVAHANGVDVFLREPTPGLSRARNDGWRTAQSPVVAFIDDDAVADPTWLDEALHFRDEWGLEGGVFGGPIVPLWESPPPAWFPEGAEGREWGTSPRLLERAETLSASNLFVARPLLDELGGFDARLGMGADGRFLLGEETSLFERIWALPDAERPRLAYSPALVTRHAVPREKMTVRYQLRRAIASGESWSIQHDPGTRRGRLSGAGSKARSATWNLRGALLRLRRPLRGWAIEALVPVAHDLGAARGLMRKVPFR